MSAGRDQIADAVRSRSRLIQKIPHLHEIVYPDAEHTLEFEERISFVPDLVAWLNQQSAKITSVL
jgi:hypothetical protein